MKQQWVNPNWNELEQLVTLFSKTALIQAARSLLNSETIVAEHVSESHKFTDSLNELSVDDRELSKRIAKRVYQIRNAIVHSKEDDTGKQPLLLFQSSDEELIDLDSALLSILAKEAIRSLGNEEPL